MAASTLIASLDRELWLVTAQAGTRRSGLIATFVTPASIVADMPRFLVGLSKRHCTWELVEASGAFALHLLGPQNLEYAWRFGLASGHAVDKFADLEVHAAGTGSPLLSDVIGWLDCRVEERMDTGDRTIYLAQPIEGCVKQAGPPLTQRQLMQLTPPNKRAELTRQRHEDSLADGEAIRAWREK